MSLLSVERHHVDGIMRTAPTQDNVIDRMFGWWYAIAAPSAVLENTSQRTGNSARKGKYTSLVLLIELIDTLLTYFVNGGPQLFISLIITSLMLCIGIYLNRSGKTLAAGWLVVVTIEICMISYILTSGLIGPGLSFRAFPLFIILVQPQLIAISLFPPKVSLPIGLFNCAFMAAAITFLPKTPEMINYISEELFANYFAPISNLVLISLISLLWANSALREMRRADQSEEVTKLVQDIMKDPGLLKMMLERLEIDKQITPVRNFAEEVTYWNDNHEGLW